MSKNLFDNNIILFYILNYNTKMFSNKTCKSLTKLKVGGDKL